MVKMGGWDKILSYYVVCSRTNKENGVSSVNSTENVLLSAFLYIFKVNYV